MDQNVLTVYGADEDTVERCWSLYEQVGCMAEVARQAGLPYPTVRRIFHSDMIRLYDIRAAKAEEVALRWEGQERQSAAVCGRVVKLLDQMLDHIERCMAEGMKETDLVNYKGVKMGPVEALQWVLSTKQADVVGRIAYTASRICDSARATAAETAGGMKKIQAGADPSRMTDGELTGLVMEMEASGMEIPWGVRMWREAQQAKARAGGT